MSENFVRTVSDQFYWKNGVPLSADDYVCQVDRRDARGLAWTFANCVCVLFWLLGSSSVAAELAPRAPLGQVWEAPLAEGFLYYKEVEALIQAYEAKVGQPLSVGERSKVGLKINTRGGKGLSTPLQLIRAVVDSLESRGVPRESILIIDYSGHNLREAGVMPPLSASRSAFEGSPVIALDSGEHYDADWFYDSPLPPAQQQLQFVSEGRRAAELEQGMQERKSFLPAPLLFEVDFWINLAVGVDDPALGVDGVLANATLWNVSNSRRFLVNQATASAAVAEIAAIPEIEERLILNFVSLERYQFIAGPFFNSIYTRSEPRLWMSSDPIALDRLLYDRMNEMRILEGFSEIDPLPRQLPFAASLGLGVFERSQIRIEKLKLDLPAYELPEKRSVLPRPVEESKGWLQRMTPW